MHYYPHHINDYRAATVHLSNEEDLAYRRLLEMYYDTEQQIPLETQWVARRLRVGTEALDSVLGDFFERTETGWKNAKCDQVIREYHEMADKNRRNGAKGGRPKANKQAAENPLGSQSVANGNPLESQLKPEPKPEPVKEETNVSVDKVDRLPVCDRQAVVDLYHEVLPELPRVRVMNDSRGRIITSRWRWVLTSKKSDGTRRAETAEEALAWLRQFFEFARQNDFVMGRGYRDPKHSNWQADIEYLLSDRGLKQVVEKTGGAE